MVKASGAVSGSWLVYYEQRDESAYRFNFSRETSGLEMWLYIQTSPEDRRGYDDDWIRITVVGKPFEVATSEGNYIVEPIVGLTRIGYKNDREKSVGGLHAAYYVLPKKNYVNYVNITVHAPFGKPRLDLSKSYIKAWEPNVDIVQLVTWNLGWYAFNVTEDGRGRTALASFGLPVGSQPSESGLTFSFGKAFTPPRILWKPDVYIEVSYAGGINIAPESFTGTGNYRCKIDAGIGNGTFLNEAVAFGLAQTVYSVNKGGIPLPVEEAASGAIDILLEIGEDVLESPLAEAILRGLGYVKLVYDFASLIATLGFDETVAESQILVFKDVDIKAERFFAWFNFYAQIKSAGLSGGIVNFWGECPFGSSIFDYLGYSVTDLPNSGMQVGGILLDYYDPDYAGGNVIVVLPDGYVSPVTTLITSNDFKVYTLTRDDTATIVLERDNVILDGLGHTLNGGVVVTQTRATRRENITITSVKINGGLNGGELYNAIGLWPIILDRYDKVGVFLLDAFNVTITGNVIADCQVGVVLKGAQFCTVLANNIAGANVGVFLDQRGCYYYTENNVISDNDVYSCEIGIFTLNDYGTTSITRNNLTLNAVGIEAEGGTETISYNRIVQCGQGIVTRAHTGGKLVYKNAVLNCTYGIDMWGEAVKIYENYIAHCTDFGIRSSDCNVSRNEILDCGYGVVGGGFIEANSIFNCTFGIGHSYGEIVGNRIANATTGIYLSGDEILARQKPPSVFRNDVRFCHVGVHLQDLGDVTVRGNNFISNGYGIYLTAFWWHAREISENNFVRNNVSIFVAHEDFGDIIATIFHNNFIENAHKPGGKPWWCSWDNGAEGNFWSDYSGTDADGNGIGDTPYNISGQASDNHPLMEPLGELTPVTTSYTIQGGAAIRLTSNSIISDFRYTPENRAISFYVSWRKGTRGFVDIKIPKSIVSGQPEVLFDGKPIPFNKSESEDYINVNFTYEHSRHEVVIRFKQEETLFEQGYLYMVMFCGAAFVLLFSLAILVRRRRAGKVIRNPFKH
jgi:nitrous oxidase accessory protein NosD